MRKFRLSDEQLHNIGEGVKAGGRLAFYLLAAALSCSSVTDEIKRKIRYSGDVSYSDAVNAIMDSNMLSSYKQEAVAALAKDRDKEFYKAVIHVVNSDMMGSYKGDAIKNMCDNN